MKTLWNLFVTVMVAIMALELAIGIFMFGIRTQQTADEESLNPSNYEVKISADGIGVESKLTETDIIKKTISNIVDDIDAWFDSEDDFDESL